MLAEIPMRLSRMEISLSSSSKGFSLRCFRFRCFLCWRFLLQHLMDALQQKLPLNRLRHIILRTKADCLPHQLIAVNRGNKNADTRKSPLFDVFQNP